jgi:hypothetical protein
MLADQREYSIQDVSKTAGVSILGFLRGRNRMRILRPGEPQEATGFTKRPSRYGRCGSPWSNSVSGTWPTTCATESRRFSPHERRKGLI